MEYLHVQDVQVPRLGLGTWQLEGTECRSAVATAIGLGYRHLDTAQMYGNESEVGAGIVTSGVERSELWISTKIANDNHEAGALRRSFDQSLEDLGTDHVDLLLLHWPLEGEGWKRALTAMGHLRDEGRAQHLGVSNFTPDQLAEALEIAPLLNIQVEHHVYLDQPDLRAMCEEHDLFLTAYSPIARGDVLDDDVVREIADAHDASPVQVAMRFLLDRDERVAVIPKATSEEHLASNFETLRLELTDDERTRLEELAAGRRLIDPDFAPDWQRAG